jgi:hypothetical protein
MVKARVAVWVGWWAVVTLGCSRAATPPATASSAARAEPALRTEPAAPGPQIASLSVEIRNDTALVAGQSVPGDVLSLRGALARHRGGASTAEVRLVEPRPELVDNLVRAAAATELKRLVLAFDSSSVEVRIGALGVATHELSATDDGRVHLRSVRQPPESDNLASWLPGQASEEEAARRKLFDQCATQSCQLRLRPRADKPEQALFGLVAAGQRLSVGASPVPLTFVTEGWAEPRTRIGATTVSGRLPPEVIQRVVREHFTVLRKCYEVGLGRDPNLTGRVVVRFVIGRDGKVSAVKDGGSDIPDAQVRECVLGAFSALEFPAPEGGIVTVVYPILLAPE